MLKKISYVLNRKQKINLLILLVIIFIGAFVELLGVSMILPFVNAVMDAESLQNKWYFTMAQEWFGITTSEQIIIFLAVVLIAIYIVKNIYITMMNYVQYYFTFENQRKLAVKLLDCYMHQKYLFHVSKNVAELQRNVTNDVNGFYTVVLNTLQFLAEISVCVVLIVYLLMQDVMTTMTVAVLVIIFVVFFAKFYKKALGKKGEESRKLNVQVTKWILQSFSGIKEIKVVNGEKFFIDNYDKSYKNFSLLQRQRSILTFIPRPLMETICISGLLMTVVLRINLGAGDMKDFIPTLTVFAMAAFRMLPSFNRMTGYLGNIMFNLPSINSVYNDLLDIEGLMKQREGEEYDENEIQINKEIRLEGISFKYPNTDHWILNEADLVISKNTSVAFIGSSGAGKTTVADLILGLLEPQKGKITVDGMDITKQIRAWHKCIGYIPQTIYLMDDTIRANVTFGIPDDQVDEKALRKAIKEAQLETFVNTLRDGMNTIIGDRGVKLSGGQRQRIGIARALYRNPEVLILDEATSALDNETEKEVMEAIDGLHGTRTLIVIAHRLSTIKKCDKIYEIGNGKIVLKNKQDVLG